MVEAESDALDVERLRSVDGLHGDRDQFEPHLHADTVREPPVLDLTLRRSVEHSPAEMANRRDLARATWIRPSISRLRSCSMADVPFDPEVVARVRECLNTLEVREVAMFGGRSFMVHDQLAVAAASDGSLLLRCAPDQLDRLLQRDGAQPAEMRGTTMSPGWIRVDVDALEDDDVLRQWIDDAVTYSDHRASRN